MQTRKYILTAITLIALAATTTFAKQKKFDGLQQASAVYSEALITAGVMALDVEYEFSSEVLRSAVNWPGAHPLKMEQTAFESQIIEIYGQMYRILMAKGSVTIQPLQKPGKMVTLRYYPKQAAWFIAGTDKKLMEADKKGVTYYVDDQKVFISL